MDDKLAQRQKTATKIAHDGRVDTAAFTAPLDAITEWSSRFLWIYRWSSSYSLKAVHRSVINLSKYPLFLNPTSYKAMAVFRGGNGPLSVDESSIYH